MLSSAARTILAVLSFLMLVAAIVLLGLFADALAKTGMAVKFCKAMPDIEGISDDAVCDHLYDASVAYHAKFWIPGAVLGGLAIIGFAKWLHDFRQEQRLRILGVL